MRIHIIGKQSYGLNDFILQWALQISNQNRVVVYLQDVHSIEMFTKQSVLVLETLQIEKSTEREYNGIDILQSEDSIDKTSIFVLFLEQHLSSWLYVKEQIQASGVVPDVVVYWDFQIGRYSEQYWKKAMLCELNVFNQVSMFTIMRSDRDSKSWLTQCLSGDLAIRNLTRSYINELTSLTKLIFAKQKDRRS